MTKLISYRGYRYPPEVISYAVWLYYRFTLSFRDIEDLLAARGVMVSYKSIRLWSGVREATANACRILERYMVHG
ncbi:MAG: hypothetical protein ACREV1_18865 [Gammaproteobacteria bacterium]